MKDKRLENLSKEHEKERRNMRKLLVQKSPVNRRELQDQYYKTIALAEHEAICRTLSIILENALMQRDFGV